MKYPLQQFVRGVVLAGFALASATPAIAQEKVEDRLTRIEKLLSSGALTDLVNQQEQLRQSVQDLRGEIELLRRDVDEVRQRQHDLYVDVDRRLRQLETSPTATPDSPQRPPASASEQSAPPQTGLTPPAPVSTGDELNDYQTAFALLKAGRYPQAAQSFEAFLQRYPKGQYAANALYWLGESYYVVRDFSKAQSFFQRVLEEHPDSGKQPDAMLKIGFIQFEQGEKDKARTILNKVMNDYPNSSAAALAEQRLLRISR